jgi:hypothetical protein
MTNVYIIKHNNVPIWVGVGGGDRHKIRSHCSRTVTTITKRNYIMTNFREITSEIVLDNVSIEEASQKEKELIHKALRRSGRKRTMSF